LILTSSGAEIISTILSVTGLVTIIFAFLALRPSLRISPIPKPGAPLVKSGIYKWISHPMYFAVMLFGLSMFLSHINYLTAAVLISLYLVLRTKAGMEEELLEKIHGKYKSSGFLPVRGI
jgi:protein-S-isoprenylcysteine O-methyltransferase Ste14